ncbi:MAG TPA: amino acid permease [Candidatus Angelobacter sp.]|nr:amino acid permease [Candidatus Angelobacter sp.]
MSRELRRSMSLRHATAMVIGIILGASIFIQPSEITRLVPSETGAILVWMAAGALTLCGALVCAELASAFPETGGVYVFLKRIFSPAVGFLWGWAMFWTMHSGIIAAIAVTLARYVAFFVPLGESGIRVAAVVAIVALSVVNYLGVKPGSSVQLVLTTAKIAALGAMVVLLFAFGGAAHRSLPVANLRPTASIPAYGLAIAAGLFAFGGWHMVTYAAGETRDPPQTIPRALLAGTLVVTAVYMLTNAAYLYVLPLGRVASSSRVAADATQEALGGRFGGIFPGLIAALVVISSAGALNGIILAGPRVYYAMASDGMAFGWLSRVHPRRQTPYLAIAAQALWSSVLVATNSYRELFTRVVYTEWLFFALLAAGLFFLRRRTDYRPTFSTPGYPFVPLLFIAAAVSIAINQIRADLGGSAIGLGLILMGLPVYLVWASQRVKKAVADANH